MSTSASLEHTTTNHEKAKEADGEDDVDLTWTTFMQTTSFHGMKYIFSHTFSIGRLVCFVKTREKFKWICGNFYVFIFIEFKAC